MDWTEIVIALISAVLAPSVIMLLTAAMKHLQEKTKAIENMDMRDALSRSLAELEAATVMAVGEVRETYVKQLKDAGSFEPYHAKEAFDRAFRRVKEIASDLTLETVAIATGNLDEWIRAQIEHLVAH